MAELELKLFLAAEGSLIDVRSPGEFAQGHIPGSLSLPLFSDEERAQVGTCYKQVGPEAALKLGLCLFGPRMADYWQQAMELLKGKSARVLCWRGGMRSQSVAAFLHMAKVPAATLKGGYKRYRKFALEVCQTRLDLKVLGGFTGSGKSERLQTLASTGHQVLDLEALACHRGSVFGELPGICQPTQEQFENRLASAIFALDPTLPVWVEDESRLIGKCVLPAALFDQMRRAPLTLLECSKQERTQRLLTLYSGMPPAHLLACLEKIRKKLGNSRCDEAIALGHAGRLEEALHILLDHYDSAYSHTLKGR